MAFISKIRAAAATVCATLMFAGVANASVAETAVSYGTAPSTWIVMISMLSMVGLACGGRARSASPAGKAQKSPDRAGYRLAD